MALALVLYNLKATKSLSSACGGVCFGHVVFIMFLVDVIYTDFSHYWLIDNHDAAPPRE